MFNLSLPNTTEYFQAEQLKCAGFHCFSWFLLLTLMTTLCCAPLTHSAVPSPPFFFIALCRAACSFLATIMLIFEVPLMRISHFTFRFFVGHFKNCQTRQRLAVGVAVGIAAAAY